MLAAESVGWFLEHAWLIPLIPGVAFAITILFGKFEINGKRRSASVSDGPRPASGVVAPAIWKIFSSMIVPWRSSTP